MIRITFHGGAGTVTGSRHLLTVNDTQGWDAMVPSLGESMEL